MIGISLFSFALFSSLGSALCPPPGPILPPPVLDAASPNFTIPQSVLSNFTFLQNTSFAIKASIGDDTIYEYEHSAPGREVANSLLNTTIRLASATKMITALAIVMSDDKISLEDPITKHVPDLDAELYGDVTIASLADHTSGLGRFGYVGDIALIGLNVSLLGLPKINNTLPGCDPVPGGRVCTDDEVIAMFNNPSYAPHSPHARALYSNIGYILLGRALETAHGKPYEQIIQELILDPVGMPLSTFVTPTDNTTAILPRFPWDASWFVSDFANLNPVGGLWSTTNELLKLMQAIQNNDLLSKAKLRKWLKPRVLLTSMQQYTGVSWEIMRPTNLALNYSRPIEIYTKAGGVPGYASYAVLVPEYNIAVAINAAGGAETLYRAAIDLLAAISESLIPYADELARAQAAEKYAGTYSFSTGNVTNKLTLTADDGPGLQITTLTINNVPVLRTLAADQNIPFDNFSARLYPTDPDSLGTEEESWRFMLDRKVTELGFAELGCANWIIGDPYRYGGEPLDTFVFGIDGDKAVTVELLGWRTTLTKEE